MSTENLIQTIGVLTDRSNITQTLVNELRNDVGIAPVYYEAELVYGRIITFTIQSGATEPARHAGTYYSVSGNTTTGSEQLFDVTIDANGTATVEIKNLGKHFSANDIISIPSTTFKSFSGTDLVIEVLTVSDLNIQCDSERGYIDLKYWHVPQNSNLVSHMSAFTYNNSKNIFTAPRSGRYSLRMITALRELASDSRSLQIEQRLYKPISLTPNSVYDSSVHPSIPDPTYSFDFRKASNGTTNGNTQTINFTNPAGTADAKYNGTVNVEVSSGTPFPVYDPIDGFNCTGSNFLSFTETEIRMPGDGVNEFSLEFYLKIGPGTGTRWIFAVKITPGHNNNGHQNYVLLEFYYSNGGISATGTHATNYYFVDLFQYPYSYTKPTVTNTDFHHIILMQNTSVMNLYIDNVLAISTGSRIAGLPGVNPVVRFGANQNNHAAGPENLRFFRYYQRFLTEEEVDILYYAHVHNEVREIVTTYRDNKESWMTSWDTLTSTFEFDKLLYLNSGDILGIDQKTKNRETNNISLGDNILQFVDGETRLIVRSVDNGKIGAPGSQGIPGTPGTGLPSITGTSGQVLILDESNPPQAVWSSFTEGPIHGHATYLGSGGGLEYDHTSNNPITSIQGGTGGNGYLTDVSAAPTGASTADVGYTSITGMSPTYTPAGITFIPSTTRMITPNGAVIFDNNPADNNITRLTPSRWKITSDGHYRICVSVIISDNTPTHRTTLYLWRRSGGTSQYAGTTVTLIGFEHEHRFIEHYIKNFHVSQRIEGIYELSEFDEVYCSINVDGTNGGYRTDLSTYFNIEKTTRQGPPGPTGATGLQGPAGESGGPLSVYLAASSNVSSGASSGYINYLSNPIAQNCTLTNNEFTPNRSGSYKITSHLKFTGVSGDVTSHICKTNSPGLKNNIVNAALSFDFRNVIQPTAAGALTFSDNSNTTSMILDSGAALGNFNSTDGYQGAADHYLELTSFPTATRLPENFAFELYFKLNSAGSGSNVPYGTYDQPVFTLQKERNGNMEEQFIRLYRKEAYDNDLRLRYLNRVDYDSSYNISYAYNEHGIDFTIDYTQFEHIFITYSDAVGMSVYRNGVHVQTNSNVITDTYNTSNQNYGRNNSNVIYPTRLVIGRAIDRVSAGTDHDVGIEKFPFFRYYQDTITSEQVYDIYLQHIQGVEIIGKSLGSGTVITHAIADDMSTSDSIKVHANGTFSGYSGQPSLIVESLDANAGPAGTSFPETTGTSGQILTLDNSVPPQAVWSTPEDPVQASIGFNVKKTDNQISPSTNSNPNVTGRTDLITFGSYEQIISWDLTTLYDTAGNTNPNFGAGPDIGGSAYMFKVPETGVYFFTCSWKAPRASNTYNGYWNNMKMLRNSVVTDIQTTTSMGSHNSGGVSFSTCCTHVGHFLKDDRVFMAGGGMGGTWDASNPRVGWTSFSGFKIDSIKGDRGPDGIGFPQEITGSPGQFLLLNDDNEAEWTDSVKIHGCAEFTTFSDRIYIEEEGSSTLNNDLIGYSLSNSNYVHNNGNGTTTTVTVQGQYNYPCIDTSNPPNGPLDNNTTTLYGMTPRYTPVGVTLVNGPMNGTNVPTQWKGNDRRTSGTSEPSQGSTTVPPTRWRILSSGHYKVKATIAIVDPVPTGQNWTQAWMFVRAGIMNGNTYENTTNVKVVAYKRYMPSAGSTSGNSDEGFLHFDESLELLEHDEVYIGLSHGLSSGNDNFYMANIETTFSIESISGGLRGPKGLGFPSIDDGTSGQVLTLDYSSPPQAVWSSASECAQLSGKVVTDTYSGGFNWPYTHSNAFYFQLSDYDTDFAHGITIVGTQAQHTVGGTLTNVFDANMIPMRFQIVTAGIYKMSGMVHYQKLNSTLSYNLSVFYRVRRPSINAADTYPYDIPWSSSQIAPPDAFESHDLPDRSTIEISKLLDLRVGDEVYFGFSSSESIMLPHVYNNFHLFRIR